MLFNTASSAIGHYAILTAMLAPALLMAATASLLVSANTRLPRVVDRLRALIVAWEQDAPDREPRREARVHGGERSLRQSHFVARREALRRDRVVDGAGERARHRGFRHDPGKRWCDTPRAKERFEDERPEHGRSVVRHGA